MGFLTPDRADDDDQSGPTRSLELDLEPRVCPQCRRELMPWQDRCPEDGSAPVAPSELGPADGPSVPEHLRPARDHEGPTGD